MHGGGKALAEAHEGSHPLGNDGLWSAEPRRAMPRQMHGALKAYCPRGRKQRYGMMLL